MFGPVYGGGDSFGVNVAVAEGKGVCVNDAVAVAAGTGVDVDVDDAVTVTVGAGVGVDVEHPTTALMLQVIIMK